MSERRGIALGKPSLGLLDLNSSGFIRTERLSPLVLCNALYLLSSCFGVDGGRESSIPFAQRGLKGRFQLVSIQLTSL